MRKWWTLDCVVTCTSDYIITCIYYLRNRTIDDVTIWAPCPPIHLKSRVTGVHPGLTSDCSVFHLLPGRTRSGAAGLHACSAEAGSGCWSSSLWSARTLGKLGSLPAPLLDTKRNTDQQRITKMIGKASHWHNTQEHLLIYFVIIAYYDFKFIKLTAEWWLETRQERNGNLKQHWLS